ncbi:MAG: SDR family oxidoreductase [Myxococcales bacterium]|nr:SDR family oxidoreductase [Myxococcales bacterium]MCH7866472.1 SDR family oxidoreductase [Myxococcales bacterium]
MAFSGKVAFITGGGSGMGQLAARNLAAHGVSVAALDVNTSGLADTAMGFDNIQTIAADVTVPAEIEQAVKSVEQELGPIDRVYNAAAIFPTGRLLDQDTATIQKIMQVNYGGVVNVTKITLPKMLERGSGDFINFASMAGWLPVLYLGAYNASKFAVVAFSEVLYHENRNKGVRFACVCPPPVSTPLLEQAQETVWPKIFDEVLTIEPQVVLDAIESALERDELWVFPGPGTKLGWRMRRWFPKLMWRQIHKTEGF